MKTILKLCAAVLVCGTGCDSPSRETSNYENLMEESADDSVLDTTVSNWSVYEGEIPCADCQGILLVLKLENRIGKTDNEFELSETYLATEDGDRNFVSRGFYEISYGIQEEPTAIVISLINEEREVIKTFVQEEDQGLSLLDKDNMRISSEFNYTLSKK